ncbi:Fic family protein [Pseudophaeobacter sp.]|uniref:Fic family protein n=1 Tax=Pseudophaeobacter sp. TaxID=1971739 RepID=UPI003299E86B
MAREVPADEHSDLIRVLTESEHALSLSDIHEMLTIQVPRRTLQSRLKTLVENKVVIREGQVRSTKYRLVSTSSDAPETPSAPLPLSDAGRAALAQVSQNIAARNPAGYNQTFLTNYVPNESRYLPGDLTTELLNLGSAGTHEQEAGTYAKQILQRLLVDLAWNSSRLEGNTYSLLDTRRLIDFGEAAEGKDQREAQMILNHKDAIEFLVRNVEDTGFNRYTIQNLHALLANNLLSDPAAPGRLRSIAVGIEGSAFHPLENPHLIADNFDTILEKATSIDDPFEQVFFVLAHLPYLQPFEDVNKRVSRIAANIPMIRANLVPLSFDGVPQDLYTKAMLAIYETNDIALLRDVFVFAYRRSIQTYAAVRQSLGEPDPFRIKYRTEITEVVSQILSTPMSRQDVVAFLKPWSADNMPDCDQAKFRRTIEDELLALHEGNFARYRVRPSEFRAWQALWSEINSQNN